MKVEIFESINRFEKHEWDKLTPPNFPFASFEFLSALELSDCLGRRTGWKPYYLCCLKESELVGAFIVFSKTNSYGEYIFDFAWAQAFERYGIEYYPKLVSAIPFTPATGPKILLNNSLIENQQKAVVDALIEAALELLKSTGSHSLHALFITEEETRSFAERNFLIRHSFQYHWQNESYLDFADFLSRLRSKRRKEILRERKQAQEAGVKIARLTGSALEIKHAKAMHQFYLSTVEKMGGHAYLTEAFFIQVFETMKDNILLVLAENSKGEMVAGALNYFSGEVLYGRHWGCIEEYKALHFELCYYQGIEFVIENKMKLFEAGAQGEHKFQRGFMPSLTYSAHQIKSELFKEPIRNFVEDEKRQLKLLFRDYKNLTPFSRANETDS